MSQVPPWLIVHHVDSFGDVWSEWCADCQFEHSNKGHVPKPTEGTADASQNGICVVLRV